MSTNQIGKICMDCQLMCMWSEYEYSMSYTNFGWNVCMQKPLWRLQTLNFCFGWNVSIPNRTGSYGKTFKLWLFKIHMEIEHVLFSILSLRHLVKFQLWYSPPSLCSASETQILVFKCKMDRVQECIFCGLLDKKCNKTTKKCSTLIICIEHVKDSRLRLEKIGEK